MSSTTPNTKVYTEMGMGKLFDNPRNVRLVPNATTLKNDYSLSSLKPVILLNVDDMFTTRILLQRRDSEECINVFAINEWDQVVWLSFFSEGSRYGIELAAKYLLDYSKI